VLPIAAVGRSPALPVVGVLGSSLPKALPAGRIHAKCCCSLLIYGRRP
jgi:hypothetical protein